MTGVDAKELLALARDKSESRRQELAEIISDLFVERSTALSERERELMFDILHKMIREAEMSVRRIVAKQLADLPDAPRPLIVTLANDEIEVAFPILRHSPVLQDEDLIEVIRHRTLEHQLSVAVRDQVSESVSAALVETGHESVIRDLLKNTNARISKVTMEYLVEQSKRVDSFREPILSRGDLDPELAKRMYMWVSAALRQYIVDRYDLDEAVLDDLLERSTAEELERTAAADGSKADALAGALEAEGDATRTMIQALRDGEVPLFMAILERLTGVREKLVKRIVFEPGGEGLAIACRAAGIGRDDFSSLYHLSRQARPAAGTSLHEDRERILAFFDRVTAAAAKEVTARWRRDSDYLEALHAVELAVEPVDEQKSA